MLYTPTYAVYTHHRSVLSRVKVKVLNVDTGRHKQVMESVIIRGILVALVEVFKSNSRKGLGGRLFQHGGTENVRV